MVESWFPCKERPPCHIHKLLNLFVIDCALLCVILATIGILANYSSATIITAWLLLCQTHSQCLPYEIRAQHLYLISDILIL